MFKYQKFKYRNVNSLTVTLAHCSTHLARRRATVLLCTALVVKRCWLLLKRAIYSFWVVC